MSVDFPSRPSRHIVIAVLLAASALVGLGDRPAQAHALLPPPNDDPQPFLLHVYNSYQGVLYTVNVTGGTYVGHVSVHDSEIPHAMRLAYAPDVGEMYAAVIAEGSAFPDAIQSYDATTGKDTRISRLPPPYVGPRGLSVTAQPYKLQATAQRVPGGYAALAEHNEPAPWHLITFDVQSETVTQSVPLSLRSGTPNMQSVRSPSGRWAAVTCTPHPEMIDADTAGMAIPNTPKSPRERVVVYKPKPCLAVVDLKQEVIHREILWNEERIGSFSEMAFSADDSALFVFEQAFHEVYRLGLPGAAPEPVYTLPQDPLGIPARVGLIPRGNGDVLLYFSRLDQEITFVLFDSDGRVKEEVTLPLSAKTIAASGDTTLISAAPTSSPYSDRGSFSDPVPPLPPRGVQDEMEAVTFTFVDTSTWSIERTMTVSLPKDAVLNAQLIAPPRLAP